MRPKALIGGLATLTLVASGGVALAQFDNPGFETQTTIGWSERNTSNGLGAPAVMEVYDIDGAGSKPASWAARYEVGQDVFQSGVQEGIEVDQVLYLEQGTTYTIRYAWSAFRPVGGSNAEGGVFGVIVDGTLIGTPHSVGSISGGTPVFGVYSVNYTATTSGPHDIGARVTRPYTRPSDPIYQYLDDFTVSPRTSGACPAIDFQYLAASGTGSTSQGELVGEDGYNVAQGAGEPFRLSTFNTDESRYPGSTALFNNTVNGLLRVTSANGAPFDAHNIDIANLNSPGTVQVTFTGHKNGGGTVTQTITHVDPDGILPLDLVTYTLCGFTNLDSLEWNQVTPFHQFDNLTVTPVSGAVLRPTNQHAAYNFIPFGGSGQTCTQHQVFDRGLWCGEQEISSLGFSSNYSLTTQSVSSTITIAMGYTNKIPGKDTASGGLDANLANNPNGGMTQVFTGNVTRTLTGGSTDDFEYIIRFDRPFCYDPARGNLLVEIVSIHLSGADLSVSRSAGSAQSSRAYNSTRFGNAASPTTATRMHFYEDDCQGGGPFNLRVTGPCPGTVTVSWDNALPNVTLALVFASNTGSFVIPFGPCQGTVLGLGNRNIRLVNTFGSGSGSGSRNGFAGPQACGGFLQMHDIPGCNLSNVAQIP